MMVETKIIILELPVLSFKDMHDSTTVITANI